MTPLPKRRHSTRRGGKRKASIKLSKPTLISCSNCGRKIRPHTVCPECGYYGKTSIIIKKAKRVKKES